MEYKKNTKEIRIGGSIDEVNRQILQYCQELRLQELESTLAASHEWQELERRKSEDMMRTLAVHSYDDQ